MGLHFRKGAAFDNMVAPRIMFANWGPPCRIVVENVSEWLPEPSEKESDCESYRFLHEGCPSGLSHASDPCQQRADHCNIIQNMIRAFWHPQAP